MKSKKIISLILALGIFAIIFSSCAKTQDAKESETSAEKVTIRIGGLKGATSIGMVKLLDDAENKKTGNNYEFKLAGSADELTPLFLKGELDIIAVPTNLGSVLNSKTGGKVQMLAVNTLGLLYIVEKGGNTVTDMKSLKGKTILATGKGSTPEYALTYLLAKNGIDIEKDITVNWLNEPSESVSMMAAAENAVAMLPQPYVTVAQTKLENLRTAIDLTEEWNKLNDGTMLLTAGLFVRREFSEKNPGLLKSFLKEYKASTDFANENVKEASVLVEKYDIVKAAIAEKAIPQCHIVCITGDEMKTVTKGYLEILSKYNPQSVGGNLPEDKFYYSDD